MLSHEAGRHFILILAIKIGYILNHGDREKNRFSVYLVEFIMRQGGDFYM